MKKTVLYFVCFLFSINSFSMQKGLVIVPVADLLGEPLCNGSSVTYDTLPLCGTTPACKGCPRLHQLLFNEIVTILDEKNDQFYIEIDTVYFITTSSKKPQQRYWTLKKNIAPLSKLVNNNDLKKIPSGISIGQKATLTDRSIVTLLMPWHDPITKITFSAGTRFVTVPHENNQQRYGVYVFNPKSQSFSVSFIDKNKVINAADSSEPRERFLAILKNWCHQNNGFIPYVFGGSSFVGITNDSFIEKKEKNYNYFDIPQFCATPKTGFDCSGLVLRAAQMAGIPYFYKNTYTLAELLHPLNTEDQLKDGDLIWIPGHVMIVSSIKENKMIEARSYHHGYGKVHELELSKQFKNMHSYNDLLHAYFNKQPIERINSNGETKEKIKQFKLLKLDSVL